MSDKAPISGQRWLAKVNLDDGGGAAADVVEIFR